MTTYNFHSDPGHGWLEVSREELAMLHIDDAISAYSYQSGDKVYLEEDCDAALFINAKENLGIKVQLQEHSVDGDSFVRTLPRYY